jgi:DNA-binding transcriptional MerR regulator
MFSIGEFARHGRISVRMLRRYDAVGVLVSAMVDPATGYRFYQAGQLSRLNRIIAPKDLGFSLRQVQQITRGHRPPPRHHGQRAVDGTGAGPLD